MLNDERDDGIYTTSLFVQSQPLTTSSDEETIAQFNIVFLLQRFPFSYHLPHGLPVVARHVSVVL